MLINRIRATIQHTAARKPHLLANRIGAHAKSRPRRSGDLAAADNPRWFDGRAVGRTRHQQERTISPSRRTVQAPQTPCSQRPWVPVRLQMPRRSLRIEPWQTLRVDVLAVDVKRIGIAAVTQVSGIEVGAPEARRRNGPAHFSQDAAHGSEALLIAFGDRALGERVDASDTRRLMATVDEFFRPC